MNPRNLMQQLIMGIIVVSTTVPRSSVNSLSDIFNKCDPKMKSKEELGWKQ
jgi:hypothetical protein